MTNHKKPSSIATAYDQWANIYDTNENKTRDLSAQLLREQPFTFSGRDVLELGCGTGLNTEFVAKTARTVIAGDFSHGMLQQAKQRTRQENVFYTRFDLNSSWPIQSKSVDWVLETLVLEHIFDVSHIFREAFRVLRPNGQFFLCELHPFRQYRGGQAQFTNAQTGETVLVDAFWHSISEFINTAILNGFSIRSVQEYNDPNTPEKTPPRLFSAHYQVL